VRLRLTDENQRSKRLWLIAALGTLFIAATLVITAAVVLEFLFNSHCHEVVLWSQRYKREVLAQSGGSAGELKHIEWDGWGFPGAGDITVYLVFDSTDALSVAATNHGPGKFNGIPCEVAQVRQLESHWYTVLFYTDEFWGRRNALDCTGLGR
jgi:hypothetical protein